jgi:hypothetical protein
VTSYQLSYYYEPVTTCCTTTVGAPIYGQLPAGAAAAPGGAPPVVGEGRQVPTPQPPSVGEGREFAPSTSNGTQYDRNAAPYMPKAADSSYYRQPRLQSPVPAQPAAPPNQAPPRVRLERIAVLPDQSMDGLVVSSDRVPQANARVLFVHAEQAGGRQAVTADTRGRFRVTLASGSWLVYLEDGRGKQVFQRRVEVGGDQPRTMTLVSR